MSSISFNKKTKTKQLNQESNRELSESLSELIPKTLFMTLYHKMSKIEIIIQLNDELLTIRETC